MKLPFDFGIKLIFRLVLPGFILSLGLLPLLRLVLQLNGWADKWEYAFVVLVILMGWVITISDMPLYVLLEGRKFWPGWLKTWRKKKQQERLDALIKKTDDKDKQVSDEAYFDLRSRFRINKESGDFEVVLPTRLGNLLYAYEGYSLRNHGLDAIFYWPRIWLKLDKDTREEIDNTQALADSTVYASFALFCSGLLWFLYAVTKFLIVAIQKSFSLALPLRIQYDLTLIDQRLPKKGVGLLVAILFVIAAYLVYRLSLYLHAQFGEVFKANFDLHVVNVSTVVKELSLLSQDSPTVCLSRSIRRKDQYPIASRYLQYHLYRCPNPVCNKLLKLNEIKTHKCRRFFQDDPPE